MGDGESVCQRLHARTVGARRSTLARRTVLRLMDNPVLRPMQMLVRRLTHYGPSGGHPARSGNLERRYSLRPIPERLWGRRRSKSNSREPLMHEADAGGPGNAAFVHGNGPGALQG